MRSRCKGFIFASMDLSTLDSRLGKDRESDTRWITIGPVHPQPNLGNRGDFHSFFMYRKDDETNSIVQESGGENILNHRHQ